MLSPFSPFFPCLQGEPQGEQQGELERKSISKTTTKRKSIDHTVSFCEQKERNKKVNQVFMDLVKYLAVSMILFLLGIWGIFLNRKNIIVMLMSIELMLLAVNLNFLLFSVYLDDLIGQLFALLILTVAAAESAIGLALLVVYYRVRGTIAVEFINLLKG